MTDISREQMIEVRNTDFDEAAERANFEAWYARVECYTTPKLREYFFLHAAGSYVRYSVQEAWRSWLARSRIGHMALAGATARVRVLEKQAGIIRESFLSMLADAGDKFKEHVDGDCDDQGHVRITVDYEIYTGGSQFEEFCEAMGIKARFGETMKDAIDRVLDGPPEPVALGPEDNLIEGPST